MSIITQPQTKNNWSVITSSDGGYVAQLSIANASARAEGWTVLHTNLTIEEACAIRDGLKHPVPTFDDLLIFDFTEPVEKRQNYTVQEFDLIEVPYWGNMIDGIVTYFDADTVELDGHFEISRHYVERHGRLIAKAEDDSGFIIEYAEWLDTLEQNWENLYDVAISAQNKYQKGAAA
jgi:hypothetical protein